MAVSGLPDSCENHAKCIARLALDMMDMAKNVKMGTEPVVSMIILYYNSCQSVYFPLHASENTRCTWVR